MGITKHIGKNTLGDNNKMKVSLRTYNRSTHDLSYVWRNTQAVGTLVPFMTTIGLPGDTWEIGLNANVLTHPTVGPLFGSFKFQMDVFTCPIRLYNAMLHNNALNVGLDMSKVKLPKIQFDLIGSDSVNPSLNEFKQISPSSIFAYTGLRGLAGKIDISGPARTTYMKKNALPILSYFDIFKNYYANKQEPNFFMVKALTLNRTFTYAESGQTKTPVDGLYEFIRPAYAMKFIPPMESDGEDFVITYEQNGSLRTNLLKDIAVFENRTEDGEGWYFTDTVNNLHLVGVRVKDNIKLESYPLTDIDDMRELILSAGKTEFVIARDIVDIPSVYLKLIDKTAAEGFNASKPQFGLLVKTYQSDLFNNWIQTDWIDGENGINAITAIDVTQGSFSIDTFYLAKKVYEMLNRIAISGGTYQDWIETVYTSNYIERTETPIYMGGASQEVVFQEVISNSATDTEPLGTLAGRGVLGKDSKKGGFLKFKIQEPSIIMGISSLTPRIDYYQGNEWFCDLDTLNDLHKPALDGIGFQDLLTDQMAYWSVTATASGNQRELNAVKRSIGKQPAWLNYMTNYNKVYGNFALKDNENFMVLTREYDWEVVNTNGHIAVKDATSYIDPELYNHIFADQSLSSMNFWVQIGINAKVRRMISAKQIPNL